MFNFLIPFVQNVEFIFQEANFYTNFYYQIHTCLNNNELRLALHGKITKGKLKATEITNPILITSDVRLGLKLIKMFPKK